MPSPTLVRVWHIGRMGYAKALKLQKILVNRLKNDRIGSENTLVLVEHDPVYTIGIRSKECTPGEESRLKNLGADFYRTDRGGGKDYRP
ncbi:hypothetical protein J437_LFUL002318 [Ladona fulva]|uniref:BPL/LPL catalytic domain-containing protein n=1 Tax=Ladona fulva TaxID=123851 RepID=A0A8K0NYY7_LADFU|nr:hypothetical protein J437_LFUL002318 [Ladona fulva]